MNRRALLKSAIPIGMLIAGCTSQSDGSKSTSTTQSETSTVGQSSQKSSATKSSVDDTTTRSTSKTTTDEVAGSTSKQSTTEKTTISDTKERKTTSTARSRPDHPSTKGVFDEPTRGPLPFSKDATLIVFEDPSCPNCVHFEENTYPKLKRKYADTGKLSIVFRTIPVIKPWAEEATYALESTFVRNEPSYWKLKSYYFSNQDSLNDENILDKTSDYIASNTSLSSEDVVQDAKSKAQKKQVDEDLAVAKSAGIRGTPTCYAFRSNRYMTEIIGKQGYSVYKNVLGL
ncbi:DsbA family protein [Haladaptatus sp. CMAA 1911]|uniref:DsbA family protein n=1 Tax=unclassified Haladaptatus TaxID=2622732 RepID=UPI003754E3D6